MICPSCGKENPEGSLFCNSCGTRILNEESNNTEINDKQEEVKPNENVVQDNKKLSKISQFVKDHKKLKFIIGSIFVLIILAFSIAYGYPYIQAQNKENTIKIDIKNKVSEAENYAKNNNYESAYQTLLQVKNKYHTDNTSYDGLGKIVEEKVNEYIEKSYYTQALKDIDTKDYSDLSSNVDYLITFYSDKTEVKTDLYNKVIKIIEKNAENPDLYLLLTKLQETYPDKLTEDDISNIRIQSYIKNPSIGMTTDEIEESNWGKPSHINRTTTANGTSEQWVYPNNKYIYLENGVVTSIQQ